MRKLRRLPWRLPKPHHAQQQAAQPQSAQSTQSDDRAEAELQRDLEREARLDAMNTQPVAFSGGRYVYGEQPSRARSNRQPEIRRKARHHPILPVPVAG